MMLFRAVSVPALPIAIVLLVCASGAPVTHRFDVPVIVTAAPAYDPLAAFHGGERFPRGAQLLLVKNGKAEPLLNGFASAADAAVSFDAQKVLFAGKQNPSDHWAIWELNLADDSVRKVTGGDADFIRPLYLPANQLVYARRSIRGFQLETAQLDGSTAQQITFINGNALPADVLADGRILFESAFPLGLGNLPELYLVYSDGSGAESYRCDHGTARWGGHQLASGDTVFTEGATLAHFTSPLAAAALIAAPRAQYSGQIVEASSGTWLLSARTANESHYALKSWHPGSPLMQTVLARQAEDLVQPVLLIPRQRPNHHPSGLHDWMFANLLCLDARDSRDGVLKVAPSAVRLQSIDPAGNPQTMGTAPVEPDGSFFVQVPADRPIRFALLDEKGAVLHEERGWFWSRRGEQRICVGCHTGPERASENRVPAVLLRSTTPVDLTGAPAASVAENH